MPINNHRSNNRTSVKDQVEKLKRKFTEHYLGSNVVFSPDKKFEVYALLDPRKPGNYSYRIKGTHCVIRFSFQPFYIGKGIGTRRVKEHLKEAQHGGRNRKCTKIRKILASNNKVLLKQVAKPSDELTALARESLLIQSIGRLSSQEGPLTNVSKGGQSSTGYKHTDAHRRYLSKLYSGRRVPKEIGRKISRTKKGVPLTKSHRKALSLAAKKKVWTPEMRRKIREGMNARTEEQKRLTAEKIKKARAAWTDEQRASWVESRRAASKLAVAARKLKRTQLSATNKRCRTDYAHS